MDTSTIHIRKYRSSIHEVPQTYQLKKMDTKIHIRNYPRSVSIPHGYASYFGVTGLHILLVEYKKILVTNVST